MISENSTKTRRQKVEDREHAIVSAARDMFNEKGYAKTTIADIARRSNVADGTVYLYFKNKEALARAVLSYFYTELTEAAQTGVDRLSTTRERLEFLARHHMAEVIKHRRLLEILSINDLSMDHYQGSELYRMNKAYTAVFDRVAKDGISQGHIRKTAAPWVMRDVFFGAMDYASRTIIMFRKAEDVDIFVGDLMSMLLVDGAAYGNNDLNTDLPSRLEAAARRIEIATENLERAQS